MFYISADELDKEKFNVDLNDAVNGFGLGYSLNGYVNSEAPVHVPDVFNGTLFFLEKEVIPGSKLHLRFTKMFSSSPLISRLPANTIPFAANKLLEILNHIHVKPTSVTASVMNKTLIECEEPALEGESKHCATSLESMVDFIMLSLGTTDLQASSTTVTEKSGNFEATKTYNVASVGVHALGRDKLVAACHSRPYPYAVFYCHAAGDTRWHWKVMGRRWRLLLYAIWTLLNGTQSTWLSRCSKSNLGACRFVTSCQRKMFCGPLGTSSR